MEIEHNFWMGKAIEIAKQGAIEGEVPIGALLVQSAIPAKAGNHNEIKSQKIASAHNQKESLNDPTAHAEMIVIREATKKLKNWRLLNTILYVTAEPCAMCAGAIVQSRIPLVVYGCKEDRFGAVESNHKIFDNCNSNHHPKVISRVLENECKELLQNFFENLRRGGRAVEGGSLENYCTGNCTGGSNPSLSANFY